MKISEDTRDSDKSDSEDNDHVAQVNDKPAMVDKCNTDDEEYERNIQHLNKI